MSAAYTPSSPYDFDREADVVCEAIGNHCRMTILCALHEAYAAGASERDGLEPAFDSATVAVMVADKVREMDEAASHARTSSEPLTCGRGDVFPCVHSACIERAASSAAFWAQMAARCAITLESLVACSEGR